MGGQVVPVQEGDMLAGKYRVEKILGQGGMGVVVAAYHVALNQRVAVKFLLPGAMESEESVGRFLREARAAVQIKSEHVARVSDVGTLENGAPYMVMEYLQGQDLSQMLASRGPLSISEACDFVIQACDAIGEAHKLGIVHRDLKPANMFVTPRPDGAPMVKVLDFGISKAIGDNHGNSGAVTATGMIFGSPLYMSPEQMKSAKEVDHRTDIWALGVITFELLTRTEIFTADTLAGIVARIVAEPPTPLRELRPDAPIELEQLILRCLEKKRDLRLADVAELAVGLLPWAPSHCRPIVERIVRVVKGAGASISVMPPPHRTIGVGGQTNAAWGTTNSGGGKKSSSKAPIFIVAGAFLFFTMIAGGVFLFATRGSKDEAKKPTVETEQPVAKQAAAQPPEKPKTDPEPPKTADPVKPADPVVPATATTVAAAKATAPKATATPATPATTAAPAKTAAIVATAKPTATATAKPGGGSILDDRK